MAGIASTVSVTNPGTTATISANLTGLAGFLASGAGTLILTGGANTYTGPTNITNGVVQVGTTGAGTLGSGIVSLGNSGTPSLGHRGVKGVLPNGLTNGLGVMTAVTSTTSPYVSAPCGRRESAFPDGNRHDHPASGNTNTGATGKACCRSARSQRPASPARVARSV